MWSGGRVLLLLAAIAVVLLITVVVVREQTEPAQAQRRATPADPPPINNVDPVSGKKVGPYSPTTTHKGFTIGFCCDVSRSEGRWERMSEEEKDAFVGRFVGKEAGDDQPNPGEGH
jgi:hypothetical protein